MKLGVPVLLCLDLQMEFVAPNRTWSDPEGERIASVCASILSEARAAGWAIVHAQMHPGGPIMAGHGLHQSAPGCEPLAGEVLLRRAGVSAYSHPDLDGIMECAMGAPVYVIGFSASTSMTATFLDAGERLHPLNMVEEAIGAAEVGDWSADHNRALCLETARRVGRLASRSEMFGKDAASSLSATSILAHR